MRPCVRVARQVLGVAVAVGCALTLARAGETSTPPAHMREHVITIDATSLKPPTRWYVPGITPIIWSLDPDSTDAYRTTDIKEVKLKPGSYRFGTFTFDFPFDVTLEGTLHFASSLDQCVSGRGTQLLRVSCTKTMPYGGKPEYTY